MIDNQNGFRLFMAFHLSCLIACAPNDRGSNQSDQEIPLDLIVLKSDTLISAYNESMINDTIFYNAFPSDYKTFIKLYGYDDSAGPGILYDQYEAHIQYFCDSLSFSDSLKLNKLIPISLFGKWDADGVNALQACIRDQVFENTVLVLAKIESLSFAETMSFWYFILDGPHPEDKMEVQFYSKLRQLVGDLNQEQASYIDTTYNLIILKQIH